MRTTSVADMVPLGLQGAEVRSLTVFMGNSSLVCGVDEAGRGPLAGPVCAGAVILDPTRPIEGLADSKRLSARARERLAAEIAERALTWAVGWASVEEIDRFNIRQANFLAMRRAVEGLSLKPQLALVDGHDPPPFACAVRCIVGGDASEPVISAASILAKTHRDAHMEQLDLLHPGYGLALHKGYGTRAHLEALARLGPSPAHRMSFRPVREAASSQP